MTSIFCFDNTKLGQWAGEDVILWRRFSLLRRCIRSAHLGPAAIAPDDVCPCICDHGLYHMEAASGELGSEKEMCTGGRKGLRP